MAFRVVRAARIVQVFSCLLLIVVQALPVPCSASSWIPPVREQKKEEQAPVTVIPAIYPLDTASIRESADFEEYSRDMVWDALVNHPYFRNARRHSFEPIQRAPLRGVQRQEQNAVLPETKRKIVHISKFAEPQNNSQEMQRADSLRVSVKSSDGKRVSITSSTTDMRSGLQLQSDSKNEPLVVRRLYPVWDQQSVSDMPVPGIALGFSRPMVTPEELANNAKINASVVPPMSGSWQWLDSKTLMFDPEAGQLALGTAFEIKVPKGTKALDGTVLEQEFSSAFGTCLNLPGIDFTTSPEFSVVFLFTTPIKVETLESRIEATVNDKPVPVEVAPAAVQEKPLKLRLASDDQTRRLLGNRYKKDQTFAFVPETQPPEGSRIALNLREGVEGLSGRSKTMNSSTTAFLVRAKQLLVRGADAERVYEPGEPLEVVFNQIIADNNKSDRVSVSPPIKNLQLGFSNSRLYLKGDTASGTNYTITLKRGFKSNESELDLDQNVVCRVGSYKPRLIPPAHPYALIDSSKNTYSIMSVNVNRLRVRVYNENEDQTNEVSFLWKWQYPLQERRPAATPLLDITLEPHGVADRVTETSVDLSKLILDGRHQLYICVDQVETSSVKQAESEDAGSLKPFESFSVMLQVSDLKVTCFPLENKLAFWVFDGKTGKPVEGARVTRYQRFKQTLTPTAPPAWNAHYREANDAQDVVALTDADGIAWLPGAAAEPGGSPFLVKTANDKVVVFGEGASLLLGLVRAQMDKQMVVADRKGSDAYINFELPFESSIGVLACKSNTRFALIPLKFNSRVARIAVPTYKSDDVAMHFFLKVYDTETGGKAPLLSSPRSAIAAFSHDSRWNDRPHVNQYASMLRRGALPAQVKFEIQPEANKRLKHMPKDESTDVRFAWPTSVDGLAALNDLVIDLDFQVGELHSRYTSSHSGARRSTYFPIPMMEGSRPEKVEKPKAPESSVLPPPVPKSEVFVVFPKSVVESETINLCIQIRNAKTTSAAFEISIKSKDDSKTFLSKTVDIESGVTDVYIDNFETLVAQLQGQGATLHVREVSGTTTLDLEFDTAIRTRFNETTKFLSGISGSTVNGSTLVEHSDDRLKGKLQLANYFAPIIEELEYRFEATPMLSSNFRAVRLLAFLERRRSDKSLRFEQIIKEDVSLFEEVSRQGFEWKSWLPTGEHQTEHGNMYKWSPYLMVEALLAAQEAGIDFDKSGMNSFLFRGPFVFLKGEKDIPRELSQLQSFGCYQSTRGLKEMYKNDSASLKHDQERYAKDLDDWLASRDLSAIDGEELAWTLMTCRLLPVSTSNKSALESRLWAVASRSLASDAFNKTASPRTARTVDEQLRYEPIEPITDDTTAAAALLMAVLDENAPQDIHNNPEIVAKLTKKLEKSFYETGWTNLAKAGFCLRSLYKSEKLLDKLASNGKVAFAPQGAVKAGLEPVRFNAGRPEARIYDIELTPKRPIQLDLSGDVFFNVRMESVERSAESAAESELFALRRILLPADSSSVWRTADGVWHCKKVSTVTMRVYLLPKCEMDWLVTMVPFPAGFQPIPPKEAITYDAVPAWEKDPGVREIYNRIPQKIIEKDLQLELYSRKLIPLLYRFEYSFKAANTGTFQLPPVQINKVFDSRDFARTGCDTIVIEE